MSSVIICNIDFIDIFLIQKNRYSKPKPCISQLFFAQHFRVDSVPEGRGRRRGPCWPSPGGWPASPAPQTRPAPPCSARQTGAGRSRQTDTLQHRDILTRGIGEMSLLFIPILSRRIFRVLSKVAIVTFTQLQSPITSSVNSSFITETGYW